MSFPQPSSEQAAALHLVERRGGQPLTRHALEWWHLLSLDAPSVAGTWTWFIGWCAGVQLPLTDPSAIFVAVWILYASDRLLDARPLADGSKIVDLTEMEERHRFHFRHRRLFLPCLATATLPLAVLLHPLRDEVLHMYILLAALLSGWLLLVHAVPGASRRRLPKEFAVAVFFPAAVFIPTVARAPSLRLHLLPCALLFACACFLNCVFLYAWEHPENLLRAHSFTRLGALHLPGISVLVAAACIVLLVTTNTHRPDRNPTTGLLHPALLACAVLCSTLLLLCLHALRDSITPLRLRALADLVLLTPVPLAAGAYLIAAHR